MEGMIRLFAFILALLAVLGSAATFGREYEVAYLFRSTELNALNTLASKDGAPALPFSNRGMREVFMTCVRVVRGVMYALQPAATQAVVDKNCGDLAQRALAQNPTFSAAHAVVMMTATDPALMSRSLVLSQVTGARESWLAEVRLRQGLALTGRGQADADRAVEADIGFLAQSAFGRARLAALYNQDVSARPAIVAGVNRRPEEEKAAFLKEVLRHGQD